MPHLLPLIQGFILDRVLHSNALLSRRSKAGLVLMGLSALCVFVALIFLIIALHNYLETRYTADMAALITAGFVAGLAAIFALLGFSALNQRHSRLETVKQELTDNLAALFEAVGEELDDPVRNHPKTALAAAALAGFFVANKLL